MHILSDIPNQSFEFLNAALADEYLDGGTP